MADLVSPLADPAAHDDGAHDDGAHDDGAHDDGVLVAAMVSGDPAGLEGAYRRYAARLFEYARSVLGDPAGAADAVHDTFVLAMQRAGQLRDPRRLRPWLYAIARNECLRQLRRRGRTAPLPADFEPPAVGGDPGAAAEKTEVRALVRAAAAALSPGDREVIELALRHGLSGADVAAALGVSGRHAHARLSRARAQLEQSLGALLVARAGAGRCPDLDRVIGAWDGRLTVLVRKRVSRHLRSCEDCSRRRQELLSPAALLSAYAALPFAVALRRAWPHPGGPGPGGSGAGRGGDRGGDAGRGTSGGTGGGAGVTSARPHRRRTRITAGVGVGMIVAVLAGAATLVPGWTGAAPWAAVPAGAGPTQPTALASASPPGGGIGLAGAAPGGPGPAASAEPGPASLPAAADLAGTPAATNPVGTPVPSGPPAAAELWFAAPLGLAVTRSVVCDGGQSYSLSVTAAATGTLAGATLRWRAGLKTGTLAMVVNGATARASLRRLTAPRVRWWVVATTPDGRSASSPAAIVLDPCPPDLTITWPIAGERPPVNAPPVNAR